MTVERSKLTASIDSLINDYPEVAERWRAGDPTVRAMLGSVVESVVCLSRDNDVNIIEPFIKSKDRTIIADAMNKGIMPVATPCQHTLTIENNGLESVTISQGRIIEDGTGRQWRLMASATLQADEVKKILCEQSVVVTYNHTIPISEPFYNMTAAATDDAYIAGIGIKNLTTKTAYSYAPKFMNAGAKEPVYTLSSDDLKTIIITMGDSDRVGATVQAGEEYAVSITQCYGEVDPTSLSHAALSVINEAKERQLNLYFHTSDMVRAGANPLTVSQLRLLASFPSVYDHNAVFMGNFDFLIRRHFMARFDYMAVWNEVIQEKHYGPDLDNINHLNLTVVAKNPDEQQSLISDIQKLVANADSLLDGRVRVREVEQHPHAITINGRLAAVHDMDAVRTQIKELLLADYGKTSLSASHSNPDGFNLQEIAIRIRENIQAFQDRISDFTVSGGDNELIKPHQWAYITESSISINLSRNADTGNAVWTM